MTGVRVILPLVVSAVGSARRESRGPCNTYGRP
jgi:hypothetical protein